MQLIGTVTDSHQIRYPPAIAELHDSFLRSVKPGTAVKVMMTRFYPKGTHQQKKMIWGLLMESVKRGLDEMGFDLSVLAPTAKIPPGLPIPREVLKEVFYATCGDVGPEGEYRTLSQMDIVETGTFFDKCRAYAAGVRNIQVTDPDQNWRETLEKEGE